MTDKEQIIEDVKVLKEKINMCFILLLNKLETPETIEQTIYEHLDAFVKEWNTQLARKTQELETICKAFDIEYAYDDDGKIFGRSNKLRSLEQECEELKKENQELRNSLSDSLMFRFTSQDKEVDRYRKALEEIEDFRKKHCDFWCEGNRILDIINKAKGD